MYSTSRRPWRRAALSFVVLSVMATSCSAPGEPADNADPQAVDAALEEGGELTLWTWEPTMKTVVKEFQEKYPQVKINLVNAGTTDDEYSALQNSLSAGSGIPDIAQIEYMSLPQFSLGDSLTDLTPFGAGDLESAYSPGPWGSVTLGGDGVYGLPLAAAPTALFYNEEVFKKYGVEVPTTWEEYVASARALKQADPNVYITNDTGDTTFTLAMIWQAGGNPYSVDGTNLKIDFDDAGTRRFAELWSTLIEEDLLAPITRFSDEWYQAVGAGTIATLPGGAWLRPNLESGVPLGEGKWRVAPMPEWDEGVAASSEHGGSALALIEGGQSENAALAYAFIRYSNLEDGVDLRVAEGAFPPTTKQLESDEFQNAEIPYFGGQKVNEVLAEASSNVIPGWSFLPVQAYANSIFNDSLAPAFTSGMPFMDGLLAWQAASIKYAEEQGFTVEK